MVDGNKAEGGATNAKLSLSEPSSTGGKKSIAYDEIEFSFNPKDFTLKREATWTAPKNKKAGMPEYTGTKPASMTLEMFLDASGGGDVNGPIEKLFACVAPHEKSKDDKPSPPFVSFGWGGQTYLSKAIVKSVSVKYKRFRSDGTPIRAIATVTIEELRPANPKQNPTSGGIETRTEHAYTAGDTLASVAFAELGSPTLWRVVAESNDIDDPFRVPIGRKLLVPSLNSTRSAASARHRHHAQIQPQQRSGG